MSRSVCHVATAADAGKRLDALLAEHALYASRSAAARAVEEGRVLVGGRVAAKKHKVSAGEAVVCELDEEPEQLPVYGQPIDLDIRYEDEDLIVLSKQVGLVCHPSVDHADGTLVNALIFHCGAENLCNVQGEDDRLGIVHRLDRDTSGLMLAAKTDEAGLALMDDIRARAIDRRYIALVHGVMAHDTGMVDAPIARAASERTRMAVRDVPSAREAITTFRVLERFEHARRDDGYTLIECKLFTGRTHQIRVHMQYTRHPIVGDPVYVANGPRDPEAQLGLRRQFLHSFRVGFAHPLTGEELSFADNLPRDLAAVLDDLKERSMGKTAAGEEVAALMARSPKPSIEGVIYD
ncbi:RluA family pseudouridine synthase [Adlercreutzia sp. ZJ242]|uniref:RluA family pseudouridine synthase n=1 Tax=Adlercreutzia sp. ZJ242 TaxID=2709409 RepID=UPI0013ED3C13|nr:RluA family pseudouridine synthase [Adlercreutzia sp. ZJ242]